MGAVADYQILALYNVMVRLVDDDGKARFTRLMFVRERLITAKVSKFLGLIGTYAGNQPALWANAGWGFVLRCQAVRKALIVYSEGA